MLSLGTEIIFKPTSLTSFTIAVSCAFIKVPCRKHRLMLLLIMCCKTPAVLFLSDWQFKEATFILSVPKFCCKFSRFVGLEADLSLCTKNFWDFPPDSYCRPQPEDFLYVPFHQVISHAEFLMFSDH